MRRGGSSARCRAAGDWVADDACDSTGRGCYVTSSGRWSDSKCLPGLVSAGSGLEEPLCLCGTADEEGCCTLLGSGRVWLDEPRLIEEARLGGGC